MQDSVPDPIEVSKDADAFRDAYRQWSKIIRRAESRRTEVEERPEFQELRAQYLKQFHDWVLSGRKGIKPDPTRYYDELFCDYTAEANRLKLGVDAMAIKLAGTAARWGYFLEAHFLDSITATGHRSHDFNLEGRNFSLKEIMSRLSKRAALGTPPDLSTSFNSPKADDVKNCASLLIRGIWYLQQLPDTQVMPHQSCDMSIAILDRERNWRIQYHSQLKPLIATCHAAAIRWQIDGAGTLVKCAVSWRIPDNIEWKRVVFEIRARAELEVLAATPEETHTSMHELPTPRRPDTISPSVAPNVSTPISKSDFAKVVGEGMTTKKLAILNRARNGELYQVVHRQLVIPNTDMLDKQQKERLANALAAQEHGRKRNNLKPSRANSNQLAQTRTNSNGTRLPA